ncbi:MAG: tRNA pseudouridine(55) synthase TruB, partial [Actinomycetes bacterium]
DMPAPSTAAVTSAASELTGAIQQVPPMVSAVKVSGKRLHELARSGVEVERAPRPVVVSQFDLRPTADPMVWDATISCSSGTYVRVLAAELGASLGGGAHLGSLRRTRVGPFHLEEATPLDALRLLPPVEGVRHLDHVVVSDDLVASVSVGRVLDQEAFDVGPSNAGPWAVLDERGALLAVYARHRGTTVKPSFVLAAQ